MSKNALTICTTKLEAGVYEFDINMLNLGVPGFDGIYVVSNMEMLKQNSALWLRYVVKPANMGVDRELSVPLGLIQNHRIVGGTIVGTVTVPVYNHRLYDDLIDAMGGKLHVGIIADTDVTVHNRAMMVRSIECIRGAMVLLDKSGHSFKDTRCPGYAIVDMIRRTAEETKAHTPEVSVATSEFRNIMERCFMDVGLMPDGDVTALKKIYDETIRHYRVNPMLFGGKAVLVGDTKPSDLTPEQIIGLKNQILKQLRTKEFSHVTAKCY